MWSRPQTQPRELGLVPHTRFSGATGPPVRISLPGSRGHPAPHAHLLLGTMCTRSRRGPPALLPEASPSRRGGVRDPRPGAHGTQRAHGGLRFAARRKRSRTAAGGVDAHAAASATCPGTQSRRAGRPAQRGIGRKDSARNAASRGDTGTAPSDRTGLQTHQEMVAWGHAREGRSPHGEKGPRRWRPMAARPRRAGSAAPLTHAAAAPKAKRRRRGASRDLAGEKVLTGLVRTSELWREGCRPAGVAS